MDRCVNRNWGRSGLTEQTGAPRTVVFFLLAAAPSAARASSSIEALDSRTGAGFAVRIDRSGPTDVQAHRRLQLALGELLLALRPRKMPSALFSFCVPTDSFVFTTPAITDPTHHQPTMEDIKVRLD